MSMLLFVTHRLWSIFGDSGSVVSSVVSSDPALLSFHMLTGNLDRARVLRPGMLLEAGQGLAEERFRLGGVATVIGGHGGLVQADGLGDRGGGPGGGGPRGGWPRPPPPPARSRPRSAGGVPRSPG